MGEKKSRKQELLEGIIYLFKGSLWAIVTSVPAGFSAGFVANILDPTPTGLPTSVFWTTYLPLNLVMFFIVHAIFLKSRRLDFFLQWLAGHATLIVIISTAILSLVES